MKCLLRLVPRRYRKDAKENTIKACDAQTGNLLEDDEYDSK